jgi:hypothetical protein
LAKKRLTCNIEEDLHSSLKERAAKGRVSLGTLCSALLSESLKEGEDSKDELFPDPASYASMPLDNLRKEVIRLNSSKPKNWETAVRRANIEIVRRFKVK